MPIKPLFRAALPALLSILLLTLGGCASVVPPSAIADASSRYGNAPALSPAAAGLHPGAPSREWWRELGDPRLDELMQSAMENNHDRLAALASVREARALAGVAGRAGLPQGSVSTTAQVARPSLAEADLYDQGLQPPPQRHLASLDQMVSWEIDLFGRIGTATAIAERQADAAQADAHAATALLQAELVRRYVLLRLHQQQAAQLDAELGLQQQGQKLLQARVQAGLSDTRENLVARAELAGTVAARDTMRAAIERDSAALAVLTGRAPTPSDTAWQALLTFAALPALPGNAQLEQATELLANRPDVVRADALLRAALGEAVLAERAYLPRLSVNLGFGVNAAMGKLGQAGAWRYAAGPALQWDWLDAGRISLRALAAQAGSERAWHQFEQTVLQALDDSENSVREWTVAQVALHAAREAENAARAVSDYSAARVDAGLEIPGVRLEHRLALLRSQRELSTRHAEALQAFAQVQLSLAAWKP